MHRTLKAPRNRRTGFTLVELLVVIGIIATLMAILLPSVMQVLSRMEDVRQVAEIKQLGQRLELFKEKYGRYPPSQILLIEKGAYDLSNAVHAYSYEYLRLLFGGDFYLSADAASPHEHDWDGDGDATAGLAYFLEGDQCLVYFLGGPLQRGFFHKKSDPVPPLSRLNLYKDKARDAPFYEFENIRLVIAPNPLGLATRTGSAVKFKVYNDRFGTPYAYFLARDARFNNYFNDCPSLCGAAFVPYFKKQEPVAALTTTYYHAPDTYQIVSAGRLILDSRLPAANPTQFGVGGFYSQDPISVASDADGNNFASFASGQLRFGQ